jgi:hypothetical protein
MDIKLSHNKHDNQTNKHCYRLPSHHRLIAVACAKKHHQTKTAN